MPLEPTDDVDSEAGERTTEPRLATVETAEGVIIYDQHNHRSWLHADTAVSVGDRR